MPNPTSKTQVVLTTLSILLLASLLAYPAKSVAMACMELLAITILLGAVLVIIGLMAQLLIVVLGCLMGPTPSETSTSV